MDAQRQMRPAVPAMIGRGAVRALNLLYPPLCVSCRARVGEAHSLFRYDDASKPLILAFKHGDRLDHAPAFARWLERTGRPLFADIDVLVPVPLHRWRLWKRRYNQAAVLAERLGKLAQRPHDPLALERSRL